DWSAPWSTWITLLLLIGGAVFVIAIYAREHSPRGRAWKFLLGGIRIALVALVVFMFYRLVLRPFRTDLPDLIVVIDDSASMAFADPLDGAAKLAALRRRVAQLKLDEPTRANLAKTLLLENDANLLARLGERYNLKFYLAAGSLRPLIAADDDLPQAIAGIAADQPDSRLGRCVLDAVQGQRGRPTAAVIVFTDGVTSEGKTIWDVADVARRKGVPLFTVGMGSDKALRDVWLAGVSVDEIVFVGDVTPIDFKLAGAGYDGATVEVRLKDKKTGQVLDRTRVEVSDDGQPHSGRLRHRPQQPGEMEYVVEVVAPEGDSNRTNNEETRTVQVRDESIRVLLVQDYPNYEFRYLKNLLSRQLKVGPAGADGERAKSIQLTTVLQSADRDYAALDETALPVFPVRREELFEYDVIIFGDVNPSLLSRRAMENIAAFAKERGGGIVFCAGPRYTPLAYRGTPLAELFPINLDVARAPDARQALAESFIAQPTTFGVSSPQMQLADTPAASLQTWARLPGLYWFLEAPELRLGARVLAEHPARSGADGRPLPIIAMHYVGAGNVVFHATDETWRWRFRTGDAYWGRYWLQTIRYLSRAKLLGKSRTAEITTDRQIYRRGDAVELRVRFLDDRQAPADD
ncbi:MAG: hypothetical protein KDA41_11315, partial [Planctomycetales bacterium]|nr:hypothetical protein [Planctomycetales bacterium]